MKEMIQAIRNSPGQMAVTRLSLKEFCKASRSSKSENGYTDTL